jgi:hypothetical protein
MTYLNEKYNHSFELWELLDGVVYDDRVGNYWTIQESWSLYIRRSLEILYEDIYGLELNLVLDDVEFLP